MNLSKVTLRQGMRPIDADGKDLSPYELIERANKIVMANYCLIFLQIFKDNPSIQTLRLLGDQNQEYDDNNYFTDVGLNDLLLKDAHGAQIDRFNLGDEIFSTSLSYEVEEDDSGLAVHGWLSDSAPFSDSRNDMQYFYVDLGSSVLNLSREEVTPFLGDSVDLDDFYKVLVRR
jgi:hypothetical protein